MHTQLSCYGIWREFLKKVVRRLQKLNTSDPSGVASWSYETLRWKLLYFEKYTCKISRHLLTKWNFGVKEKKTKIIQRHSKEEQRARVNNGSPTFICTTEVANRRLIANTQHISRNQRGPETVLLLQGKHQRTAQQLMWHNSGGRYGIHYISIHRHYWWSQLPDNREGF